MSQPTATRLAPTGEVSRFLHHHFRHFNAAALVDAANGYWNADPHATAA